MKNKQFTANDQQLLEEIMLYRRDVRGNNFTAEPVPEAVIEKILLSASLAPSVGFSQPWEFVMIKDKEIKKQIANSFGLENKKAAQLFDDEKRALYAQLKLEGILEAPLNIAVFYKPSPQPVLGQNSMVEMGEYSVVCAVQNMWLMARSLNVGIGWVSILNPEAVKKTLKAPPENKLVAYLCVGYVKEFLDKPELEKINWAARKLLSTAVYTETYAADQSEAFDGC
ncbi:MAG: 5,6-dimethylbenzimidazole synthase [Proteobacteria bacterium]|nr:MAG: 5,6-dimethylbenzimidazole synthase [Pseudomonadota bacterium]